jgi:hypothetical protein
MLFRGDNEIKYALQSYMDDDNTEDIEENDIDDEQ